VSQQPLSFAPLQNGLDYLESVVEHLRDGPDQRDLKYAILHLQAATEVLLKVRLMREHWSLVFKNVDYANQSALSSGDFHSVDLKETLTRLKGIAGITPPSQHRDGFIKLSDERNKLQHYGLTSGVQGIQSLVGLVLDGLLCFIRDHLRPDATTDELAVLDDTQELIREERDRIDLLVQAIWSRITPELDELDPVVVCPNCRQAALAVDDPLKCHFCERIWEPRKVAAEYASEIVGVSWHDIAKGAEPACRSCPYCGSETLVGPSPTRRNPHADYWICFNCQEYPLFARLSECLKCGELMEMDGETGTVCQSCFDSAVYRD
jgi:DNA-directed RNA polymerase subunit RPC12/RpoP